MTPAPQPCDGGLPGGATTCARPTACVICRRCREHCRCAPGVDLRGEPVSRFTYPRTATVMVDGLALSNPRLLLGADPHAPAIVEARAVMEFRLDPRVEMLVRRAILGAPFGDRGCFHDGCAPTEAREEGGTHWCTMAPVARCAR